MDWLLLTLPQNVTAWIHCVHYLSETAVDLTQHESKDNSIQTISSGKTKDRAYGSSLVHDQNTRMDGYKSHQEIIVRRICELCVRPYHSIKRVQNCMTETMLQHKVTGLGKIKHLGVTTKIFVNYFFHSSIHTSELAEPPCTSSRSCWCAVRHVCSNSGLAGLAQRPAPTHEGQMQIQIQPLCWSEVVHLHWVAQGMGKGDGMVFWV